MRPVPERWVMQLFIGLHKFSYPPGGYGFIRIYPYPIRIYPWLNGSAEGHSPETRKPRCQAGAITVIADICNQQSTRIKYESSIPELWPNTKLTPVISQDVSLAKTYDGMPVIS